MSDLDILFPGREISAGGEKLTLQPFTFGKLPKAAKLLQPIASSLSAAGIFGIEQAAGEVQFRLASDWPLKIVDMLAEGGEGLLSFIAFASGKELAWVESLPADDGVALTKAVMEINADFFVQRVLPMLGMVTPASPSAGENLSASSSAADIDATTSTDTPSDKFSSTSEPSSEPAAV